MTRIEREAYLVDYHSLGEIKQVFIARKVAGCFVVQERNKKGLVNEFYMKETTMSNHFGILCNTYREALIKTIQMLESGIKLDNGIIEHCYKKIAKTNRKLKTLYKELENREESEP